MIKQMTFVTVLLPCVALTGCLTTTGVATVTERVLCEAWRDSLPNRSMDDTLETRREISYAYDVQAVACPQYPKF